MGGITIHRHLSGVAQEPPAETVVAFVDILWVAQELAFAALFGQN